MSVPEPRWSLKFADNTSPRNSPVRLIVLHDTCGAGTHADTEYLAHQSDGRSVSVDFTVEKDGTIWKLNPDLATVCCWHAGRNTAWHDLRDGQINHASVGIEIVQSAKGVEYTAAQLQAVAHLCAWLCERFGLAATEITTHAKIITDGSRDDPRNFPFDGPGGFWDRFSRVREGQSVPRPANPAYTPNAESAKRLGRILDLVRASPRLEPHLEGLEYMCRLPGAVYIQSDLDLDTDGVRDSHVTYESTHQDSVSIGGNVNSNVTPYFVLPGGFAASYNVKLGDVAAVLYRDRLCFAVFADTGPRGKIGEGSIALHRALGFERIRVDGRIQDVGISSGVVTLVFAGSGDGTVQTPERIAAIGHERFAALGGVP